MRTPRVSVVMPVYNSRPGDFSRSFQALIGQSYRDFELILSDNGSTQDARDMYEKAARLDDRVRYLRHAHNYGAALNFNFAFAQARGEYFMWSADDDLRHQDYLARTVPRLDRNREAVTVGTHVVLVDDAGARRLVERFDDRFGLPRAWERIPVRGPLRMGDYLDIYSLHRRGALARTHLNQAVHGADVLLVRELLLQGPFERVKEELFYYRLPSSYDMGQLAVAMLGSQSRKMLFRFPLQHVALQMLVAVMTNDVPLDDGERRTCAAALAASLVRHGWLTEELYAHYWRRSGECFAAGDYAAAAASAVRAFIASPTRPLRPELWRRLFERALALSSRGRY